MWLKRSFFFLALALAAAACQSIQQMRNFANCNFRRQDLGQFNVAGLDFSGKRALTDFGLADAARIGQALRQPTFPVNFVANVEVKNPNAEPARMLKLDWIAVIDGKDVVSGTLDQPVNVAGNGGTAIMPLSINMDLKKVLAADGGTSALLGFLFDSAMKGNESTRIGLKIKPYVRIANIDVPYPGFITIKKEFE